MNLKHYTLIFLAVVVYTTASAQLKIIKQFTAGGNLDDDLQSACLTKDGGWIAAGTSSSRVTCQKTENTRGGEDYWVIKYNKSGTVQWDKTIGGGSDDYFPSVQQTSDGGYIVGGSSYSDKEGDKSENGKGRTDYWIIKLDKNGAI